MYSGCSGVCDLCYNSTGESQTLASSQISQHDTTRLVRHIIPGIVVLIWSLVKAWWYTWVILVLPRSLTVLLLSQAFHDAIRECRTLFTMFPTVAYNATCTEAGGKARCQWHQAWSGVVFFQMNYRCKGIHRCGRYLVPIDLSAKEGTCIWI